MWPLHFFCFTPALILALAGIADYVTLKADQGDVYYYLHKKLDDNYDVISALERQLVVETADREKTETEYNRRIDELRLRRDEELGPLNERLVAVDEQVLLEEEKNRKNKKRKTHTHCTGK